VGVAPIAGRVSGTRLARIADLAAEHGSGRVRLTPHQKLLVLDVPGDDVEALVEALDAEDLPAPARRSSAAA
jgi:sulfite reductase (ferredoxin)